jgi:flagellar protein FliO/FliZ
MLDVLFGADMPLAARLVIALVVVVGLLGATTWMIRRFGARRLGASPKARQPHLAVTDVATVDARRRLILIRRNGTEHLMMVGGPSDILIEANIVPAATVREAQAAYPPVADDVLPRRAPPPGEDATRTSQPEPAQPEPSPRQSEQAHRAQPPMRPQQPPAPPPMAPTIQREPRVGNPLDRLAEMLVRTPQPDTNATQSRSRPQEMLPLPAPQREPRTPRAQPMTPPPASPTSAQPQAPLRAPASRTERSSAFTRPSPDD